MRQAHNDLLAEGLSDFIRAGVLERSEGLKSRQSFEFLEFFDVGDFVFSEIEVFNGGEVRDAFEFVESIFAKVKTLQFRKVGERRNIVDLIFSKIEFGEFVHATEPFEAF